MSTKVSNSVPPPTETEVALQEQQLELATFQLSELQKQSELQEQFAEQLGPALEQQQLDADAAREQLAFTQPIQNELLERALEDVRQGTRATPEQLEEINAAADASIEAFGFDVDRFEEQGVEGIDNLTRSLGLRERNDADSPHRERLDRLFAEGARLRGQQAAGARELGATARLNLPLAQGQLQLQKTTGASAVASSISDFQARLRSQAFSNRLGLHHQQICLYLIHSYLFHLVLEDSLLYYHYPLTSRFLFHLLPCIHRITFLSE